MYEALRPLVIRPAHPDDLRGVMELLRHRGTGMTSLPADPGVIARKLANSWELLTEADHVAHHKLLFVLADPQGPTIAGITGIMPALGGERPTWHFAIESLERAAASLELVHTRRVLRPSEACTGSTEVGSLLLHPEWRGGGYGALLAGCRYLFIAEHRAWFADTTIAQMRGVSDRHGRSPFWEAVGQRFFPLTFVEADRLSGLGYDDWVPELMPRHPIYLDLLPAAAQEAIGRVHPQTEPALHMLMAQGFNRTPFIDLFDGGPVVACSTDAIRDVATACGARVRIAHHHGEERSLIAHGHGRHFRCARITIQRHAEDVVIEARDAEVLGVADGGHVRVTPPRAERAAA